jgi:hypothetical protein
MKLSKTILAIVAAIAAAGFACQQAQATQISILQLRGDATFNSTQLGSATEVTAFNNVTTGMGNTGVFGGISAGTPVAMSSPYIFIPSTGTPNLLSVGGFTFDLQTSTVSMHTNSSLTIDGTGLLFGPGFDIHGTPGDWVFTSQDATNGHSHQATFTFSANVASQATPDSGMTVALLGAGLIGIAVFRAKFATAKS